MLGWTVLGAVLLLSAGSARAADGAWVNTGAGNWNDTSRWVGGVAASGAGSTAWFTNATAATVNQNVSGLTLGGLVFANAAYLVTNLAVTLDNGASPAAVTVGAGHVASEAVVAAPVGGAGGLEKRGPGRLQLASPAPGALAGPVTVSAGTLLAAATNGAPLGSGSIALLGGTLEVMPGGSGADVALAAADAAADSKLSYGPGPTLLRFSRGEQSSVTLTLGHAAAAADSVLARLDGGTLVIAPTNGTGAANLGAAERLFVNGGVAVHNGMVSAAIVGRNADARPGGEFLTYGANGFETAAYADGTEGGAGSIANVTTNSASGSASVYALRMGDGATLAIGDGATVTVGDGVRPAGVILNSTAAQGAAITNGTLAFGASEGVVFIGEARDGQNPARITSALTGSAGVTLAGLTPLADFELATPSGNTYSGGTRIDNGRVRVAAANRLSAGAVTVRGHGGWGGQLWLQNAMTLTNTLRLAGLCGYSEPHSFGTLRLEAGGTVLSGPIELLDDARLSVSGGGKTVTISGTISGPGAFEANAPYTSYTYGTLLLTGANTYSGGTRVNRGELRLGTGGTLGSGPVWNNATLTFASASPMTLTNALSGRGALVQQGPGALTLGGAIDYAGPLTLHADLELDGRDAAFGALSGTGRVSNASEDAVTLTVGSANTSSAFAGRIEGDVALVKTGSGTLTLVDANSYGGATTVSGGTLALGGGLIADGLVYRLDASDAARVALDGSNVTSWAVSAGGGVFTQSTASLQPVYVTNAINGRPAVRFGYAGTRTRLAGSQSAAAQTVFILNRKLAHVGLAGIWGQSGQDFGIRAETDTAWQHPGNGSDFSNGGQMFINGVAGKTFTAGAAHLVTARRSAAHTATHALGDYWNHATYLRFYRGDVGEVAVYNRDLGAVERQRVETHLMRKWLGVGAQPANLLPTTTELTVAGGATFDLGGANQALAGLAGAGAVRNSGADPVTLTVGGAADSTFYGTVAGAVSLVKAGAGTLTLYGTNAHSGATVVEAGTLKLGEWPLAAGLAYRLDAAAAGTLTLDTSNVTAWADASGGAVALTQAAADRQPVYVENAINGLPAVRFRNTRNRLATAQKVDAQTVFVVNRKTEHRDFGGLWGFAGADTGVRAPSGSSAVWAHPGNNGDFSNGGQMFINGVAGTGFTLGVPHLVTAVRPAATNIATALGDYWFSGTYTTRYYIGEVGEVLVYDRALATSERQSVEAYLMAKWLGAGVPHLLPSNGTVTVAAGATLDLGGHTQALAGLSGGGAVVNGTLAVSGQTAPGGADAVGALSLAQTPQLAGTLLIDVRADGTCDTLAVSGDLDVSQLELVIADTAQLGTVRYVIATCAGALTGSFTGDNLPEKTWAVKYDRTPGAGRVLLVPTTGTLISVN